LPSLRSLALCASSVALLGSRRRREGEGWLFVDRRRRCTDTLLAANAAAFAAQLLSRGALLGWGAKARLALAFSGDRLSASRR